MTSTTRSHAALSRVTVVGERRRIDLLLPSQEPVGHLLPDVLRMLEEPPGTTPGVRRLVTGTGAVLAPDDSLASAAIADGAVLRLVHRRETPAAPVVHDVTDEVAEDVDTRRWRWDDRIRNATAGVAAVALGVITASLARSWYGSDDVGGWLLGVGLAAAALGALASLLRNRELGGVLIVLGGAVGAMGAWSSTGGSDRARLAAIGGAVVLVLVLSAVFTPLGRGGLVGAGVFALLFGGWEAGAATIDDVYRLGAVMGTVAVLALGILPRYAVMAAGLTRLDDQRSGGATVSRHQVDTALAATHRGLALATVAAAGCVAVGGWFALREVNGWTVAVAALLAVVVMARARAFPLAVEVAALLAAGAVLAVRLCVVWADQPDRSPAGPLAVLCGLALVPLVVFVVRPPDHVRVRLRRFGNVVETLGVVALIPVCIGAFGVYGRLLDTF
ncbi:type VII secretion integral membrane protein EccD [Yinghuangia sp. YIM S10712]|uniref:type VII secretion integral membrane protein EccD n=1 Tax=Yinghuangia sp. YIM S10712 TaxID=3436930 RepID=UPI003F53111F